MKPERGSSYPVLLELRVQALEKLGRAAEANAEIAALPALPEAESSPGFNTSRAAQARLLKRRKSGK